MSEREGLLSAQDRAALEPRHLTDLGNARLLVEQFGQEIRYVPAWNAWIVWTGTHWSRDETGQVERFAKAVVAQLYVEAGYEQDERRRREMARHATASESVRAIRGMVLLAQSEPGISIPPSALDADPWLLNVENGTLDLRTGVLGMHNRTQLLTKMVPVTYDPAAACPTFFAFLQRIFAGRVGLIEFVQRAVGYSLTGDTRAQVLFLCWGTGANGKTTLMQALAGVFADYAATLAAETLLAKKHDAGLVLNDLASLQGARFVVAVESDMGRRLAEALVKQLTGGEAIKVKRLYADLYTIVPQFKLWIGTNHRPVIRGTDGAIWRRIRLLPFNVVIPDDEQDQALLEKLHAERPGILSWAVQGCLAWQRSGLGVPDEVRQATMEYRVAMDGLADFLAERCILERRATITAAELYDAYSDWSKRAGEAPMTKRALGLQLAERDFRTIKLGGHRGWSGVRLRTPADPQEQDASAPRTHGEPIRGDFQLRARDEELSPNPCPDASLRPEDFQEEPGWVTEGGA